MVASFVAASLLFGFIVRRWGEPWHIAFLGGLCCGLFSALFSVVVYGH